MMDTLQPPDPERALHLVNLSIGEAAAALGQSDKSLGLSWPLRQLREMAGQLVVFAEMVASGEESRQKGGIAYLAYVLGPEVEVYLVNTASPHALEAMGSIHIVRTDEVPRDIDYVLKKTKFPATAHQGMYLSYRAFADEQNPEAVRQALVLDGQLYNDDPGLLLQEAVGAWAGWKMTSKNSYSEDQQMIDMTPERRNKLGALGITNQEDKVGVDIMGRAVFRLLCRTMASSNRG